MHMGCHDAPMSDPLEQPVAASGDVSMRLAGFGLVALAGLLIGVGSLLPWVRSSLEGLPGALAPTYYGIDLPDGIVTLAAAAVVLIGLGVTRLASSPRARRLAAGAVVAASFVAFAVAGAALVTAPARVEQTAVDAIMADLDPAGTATEEQRAEVEDLVTTPLAPGPFVVMGGGLTGIVGGVLLLSWASRSEEPRPAESPLPDRPEPTDG
jgi:uncharacterized membrane protein YedE/YeeE